ncbi:MAG: hypothetical protein HPY50_01380 [Firmicutes bacterium]|nr:hypothetical protein [Bacillota bacterium]
MTILDQAVLLLTGLTALYLIVYFYRNKDQGTHNVYYLLAFLVLLAAGLLLIALGYGILANPLVVIVSTLIPALLAIGLITQFNPRQSRSYLILAIVGVLLIAATRFTGPAGLATAVLALVHSIFGLTIFFIPILAYRQGVVPSSFGWVTVGGTLISVGGIALAFLKAGVPILSKEIIFAILAPILLLMTLSYAWGFRKTFPDQRISSH